MLKNYALLIILSFAFSFHFKAQSPLEVFTEENYGGSSQLYEIVTPHKNLGSFDNTVKSFKLQQGYMATFASSADGRGYSRVYIAEDADLEVPIMPPYLHGTVSFIRTMTWHPNVTKRGWCGTGNPTEDLVATNSSWFYNWDTGVATTPSIEYVPMRHNLNWASFTPANTYDGYTHFLGYNEPDRPDQANMTVQTAIDNWKYFMESGLRVGSPSTSNPFNPWLGEFMDAAEANNLRIDFIPLHIYDDKVAWQWSGDLDWIYNRYHRPIWITEGNKGANWTGNSFPVNDPDNLSDSNANHHYNNIKGIIDVLESKSYVERYSLYNWVETRRAFIVNIDDYFRSKNPDWANYVWLQAAIQNPISTWIDASGDTDYRVLTPAGEYYANHASNKAYNPAVAYVPTWTPFQATLSYTVSEDFQNITLHWEGKNSTPVYGELINRYIVERKLTGELTFSTYYETTDYSLISTDDIVYSYVEYRIKVIGKDNVVITSPTLVFQQQTIPAVPNNLTGDAISAMKINLYWTPVNNAGAYNIKRATSIDGTYETITPFFTGTSYIDEGLTPDTDYYYKISSVNTGGESTDSSPVTVKTMVLVAPSEAVTGILVGSGDGQVKFKWDLLNDAQFYLKRSTSASGLFNIIATLDFDITEYTDATATNGITYYYKIVAFNDAGEGPDSELLVSNPNLGQHIYYNFNEILGSLPELIPLVNDDFEIPSTGKIADWKDSTITGWTSDVPTLDAGVDAIPSRGDDGYVGILNEDSAYNLTSHVIANAGESYTLTFDGINIWWGDDVKVILYYDTGDGIRHELGTKTIRLTYNTWVTGFQMTGSSTVASIGSNLGIEFENLTYVDNNPSQAHGWIGVDNLVLHVHYDLNGFVGFYTYDQWDIEAVTLASSASLTTGKEGSGLNLTGESSSYLNLKNGVVQDLTDFTIATWFNWGIKNNWQRIFDFGNGTDEYMFLTPRNGANQLQFSMKYNGVEQSLTAPVLSSGVWTHVALTLEGTLGIIYINGVEVGRKENFTLNPSVLGETTQNYIGKSQWPDPYLIGKVDEFKIYSHALNSAEVQNLMNGTLHVDDQILNPEKNYKFFSLNQSIHAVNYNNLSAKYGVYAITGQLISQGKLISSGVTNLGNYKTGIYIIRINDVSGVSAVKVLVN
jgi:hypothetical protein